MTQSKHCRERERDPPSAVCKERMKWQTCQAMQRRLPNVFHTLPGASAENRAGRTMRKGGRKQNKNTCVEPLWSFMFILLDFLLAILLAKGGADASDGSRTEKRLNVQINQEYWNCQCNETNAFFDPGIIWCISYVDQGSEGFREPRLRLDNQSRKKYVSRTEGSWWVRTDLEVQFVQTWRRPAVNRHYFLVSFWLFDPTIFGTGFLGSFGC